jgi:hypothetical protein
MSTLSYSSSITKEYDHTNAPDWFVRKAHSAWSTIVNLAPLRYAFVAEEGGPVASIEYGMSEYLGENWHLSRALLQPEYQHPMGKSLRLFHPADGSGIGKTRLEARARAVSEALERWAFQETSAGTDYMLYGYQYSDSTKGMAAFPGLWSRPARKLAMGEAFEHNAVDAWWDGQLNHHTVERKDSTVVFINNPSFKGFIALAIRHLNLNNFVAAYGIGSGDSPEAAETKAQLEAARLETLLECRDRLPLHERAVPVLDMEQRMLYFASKEGFQSMKDRIATTAWKSQKTPKVIYDGPVKGPWEKYAYVWRYALEPISKGWNIRQFAA